MALANGDVQRTLLSSSSDHGMASQEHIMPMRSNFRPFTGMLTLKEPHLSKQRPCHGLSDPLLAVILMLV